MQQVRKSANPPAFHLSTQILNTRDREFSLKAFLFVEVCNTSNLLFRSSSTAGTIGMMLSIEEQANTVRKFIIKCSG